MTPTRRTSNFAAFARTSVSHASLMVGVVPVIVSAGAVLFTGERMRARGWVAVLVSVAGAALIVAGAGGGPAGARSGPSVLGDALVVASLVCGAAWVLMAKRLMKRYPPEIVSAYVLGGGTVMVTAWVLATDGPPPTSIRPGIWLALAALGVVGTVLTTVMWNWGLARVPASRASIFVNLEPLVGAALGITVMHDPLSVFTVIGGVLIVAAAVAVSLEGGS